MNRIERAAGQASIAPLEGQTGTSVACTPITAIFLVCAGASYLYNRNQNAKGFAEDGDADLVGAGLSLGDMSGNELLAARRAQFAH